MQIIHFLALFELEKEYHLKNCDISKEEMKEILHWKIVWHKVIKYIFIMTLI